MPTNRGDLETRFWSRVVKMDGCWLWIGSVTDRGYGFLVNQGKVITAHRASWLIHHGSLPSQPEMVIHSCDVRNCVNPAHLRIGTQLDNMRDRKDRGHYASIAGERNPHAKLTASQVEEIRQRHRERRWGYLQTALDYGVSRSTISHMVNGRTW